LHFAREWIWDAVCTSGHLSFRGSAAQMCGKASPYRLVFL
jgi:hypothetical protein